VYNVVGGRSFREAGLMATRSPGLHGKKTPLAGLAGEGRRLGTQGSRPGL